MAPAPLPSEPAPQAPRPGSRRRVALTGGLAAVSLAALACVAMLGGLPASRLSPFAERLDREPAPTAVPGPADASASESAQAAAASREADASESAPGASADREAPSPEQEAPASQSAIVETAPDASTPFAGGEPPRPLDPAPAVPRLAQTVPLPMARPPEFRRPGAVDPSRRADRASRRIKTTAAPPAAEDDRSFLEKLFGIERSPPPALAYTALESTAPAPRRPIVPTPMPAPFSPAPLPAPPTGGGIAVYDISARIVTMPNGERLEAHSGLAEGLDDARYVDLRMRGPTPPGTYDLTEREQPFHGVRALRLSPVGGNAAVYGRAGLLAHTYMLGANGASNGCVSFRDYERFLQAYLRGEVQRLVVVTGHGQDAPVSIANRTSGAPSPTSTGDVRVASLP